MSSEMTPVQWRLLDRAMQEHKYKVMADRVAHGSVAIDEVFRSRINEVRLYDAIQSGLQLRLNRLLAEKAELDTATTINARLRTREGDDASAEVLSGMRRSQALRLDQLASEIAEAEEELSRLEQSFRQ